VACDKLLGLRAENGAPLVQAEPLEPLLSGLFGCLKKPDSDQNAYVMQCIATVCAQVGSAMQPIRGKMVSMFLELLEAVAQNPTNPAFTHNLFDSLGCVVHTCCSMEGDNSGAIAEFENTLFQPFGAILEMETCEEFAPYVFQIFAQILDLSRSTQLSQNYQTLFPKLLVPSVWESAGNIPAIIPLLGVYLKRGIALNDTQMQGLLGIFQKLNSDPRRAISHFGLDLVSSVFFYSDMQSYQNYVTGVFGWANERLKQKPPKKYISSFILFLSTFIRKFGSVSVLQQVIPQELFMPTLEIWVNNVVTNEMRSMATKKTSIVGLTQVVTCAEYMGNENYAQCFVPGISCILTAFASHLGSTAHSQVLELKTEDSVLHERSFRTAFSKLPSVRLAPLDPYHDVKDMKQHFVQQLAQCVKQNHNLYSALGQLNEQQQASLQQMCSDFSISLSA
jgi:exportin-2 (importin alpha re-exporter)